MLYPGLKTLINILFFIISSWILLHVLGLFGIFLALAYPIWWLFAPRLIPCFLCQIRGEQQWCPFCQKKITKASGIYPHNARSVLSNTALLFVFSIFSLGFVLTEHFLLTRYGYIPKEKTATFSIPANGEFKVGQTFPMEIKLNDISTTINAVQADLKFDPSVLEAVEIDTSKSFAEIIVQKDINNELGYVRLSGGLANPGYTGDTGVLGTVFFKGKSTGVVQVSFIESSLVLANDGQGTNILKDLAQANFLILPTEPGELFPEPSIFYTHDLSQNKRETQIALYEQESNILGTTSEDKGVNSQDNPLSEDQDEQTANQNSEKGSSGNFIFNFIAKIDKVIIDLWNKIFSIFR